MGDSDQLRLLPARLPLRDACLGQPGTAARGGRAGPGPRPGRVLDLGCGTGSDVIYLASLGWDAVGVDFAPRAIATARSRASASRSGPLHRGRRHPAARGRRGRPLRPRDRHRLLSRRTRGRRDAYRAGVAAVTSRAQTSTWPAFASPGGLAPARRARPQRRRPAAALRRRLRPSRRADDPPGRAGRGVVLHDLVRKGPGALFADRAVQALPDQVGVPVVPRVLLDHY